MDWEQAVEAEQAALLRLAALLIALATLAERAAERSPALRGFVLWLLRRAETVARDFVTGEPAPGMPTASPTGSRPGDARRLAIAFRTLARLIERQARQMVAVHADDRAGTRSRPDSRSPGPGAQLIALRVILSTVAGALPPAHAPDTS